MTDLQILAAAFQRHGTHDDSCPTRTMCGHCNCGFTAKQEEVNLVLQRLTRTVSGMYACEKCSKVVEVTAITCGECVAKR